MGPLAIARALLLFDKKSNELSADSALAVQTLSTVSYIGSIALARKV